jgi:aspartyl-tRNA(Asn)/glutamyl-tRNA(Gln) amidotransferase subunit B
MSKINEDEVEKMYTNSSNGSKENKFFNLSVTPQQIADMAKLVKENSVNRNIAKEIFDKSIKTGKSPLTLIQNINATKISDQQTLINYINDVLNKENHLKEQSTVNPNIHNFILGKIMKITSGRADPKITLTLIKKVIDESI